MSDNSAEILFQSFLLEAAERTSWHEQGCPLFNVVYLGFPLSITASPLPQHPTTTHPSTKVLLPHVNPEVIRCLAGKLMNLRFQSASAHLPLQKFLFMETVFWLCPHQQRSSELTHFARTMQNHSGSDCVVAKGTPNKDSLQALSTVFFFFLMTQYFSCNS